MEVKCAICGKKIEKNFLGKLFGSVVYVGKGENRKVFYVCSSCQREHGDKIREVLKE